MIRFAVLAACGAMILPAAALAAEPATPPASPSAASPQPEKIKSKKDRMVCKTMDEKGSRLGGKRVCRPQAEWDELAAQQRHEIERRLTLGPARQ